jgi:hypothetical protein
MGRDGILEMKDRRVEEVGRDGKVHGSIWEGETYICWLLDQYFCILSNCFNSPAGR